MRANDSTLEVHRFGKLCFAIARQKSWPVNRPSVIQIGSTEAAESERAARTQLSPTTLLVFPEVLNGLALFVSWFKNIGAFPRLASSSLVVKILGPLRMTIRSADHMEFKLSVKPTQTNNLRPNLESP
jgi:hypothetical protein